MNKTHLLVIDPQVDFCMPANPTLATKLRVANGGVSSPEIDLIGNGGSLYVTGADQDMVRLAAMIDRLGRKISNIHVTLDSHQEAHIAHAMFWVDSKGNHPKPYTMISEDDVKNGVWIPYSLKDRPRAMEYVSKLKTNGRYALIIWPTHCVISTYGAAVFPVFGKSLSNWCKTYFKTIDFCPKGSNPYTENYSAVMADVIDDNDPTTMLNTTLINVLQTADTLLLAGEALGFCMANTVTDIANNFGDENIKKFVLLTDCTSNVTGYEKLGNDFIDAMTKRGMQLATSADFLA